MPPTHEPHPTKRLMRLDFHTKSYSDAFACPICGLACRFNLNFLGRRVPMCDGRQIKRGPVLTLAAWQSLTALAKLEKQNDAPSISGEASEDSSRTDAR